MVERDIRHKTSRANYWLRRNLEAIVRPAPVPQHVIHDAVGMFQMGVQQGWRDIDPIYFLPPGVVRKRMDNFKEHVMVLHIEDEDDLKNSRVWGVKYALDYVADKVIKFPVNLPLPKIFDIGRRCGRGQGWNVQNILDEKLLYVPCSGKNTRGLVGFFMNVKEPEVMYLDLAICDGWLTVKSRFHFAAANFSEDFCLLRGSP